MGGVGSGRKPNILKKMMQQTKSSGNTFVIPASEGDNVRGTKRQTPVADVDLVNKEYVDDSDFWLRSGTQLTTKTANDSVRIDGKLGIGTDVQPTNLMGLNSAGTHNSIYLKGDDDKSHSLYLGKDTETALIRPQNTNNIVLWAGGTSVITAQNDGDVVLLRDLDVTRNLDVTGTSQLDGNVGIGGNLVMVGYIDIAGQTLWINGGATGKLTQDANGVYLRAYTGKSLSLETNNTAGTGIHINSSGNVGIGTTTPDRQFDIESSTHALMRIQTTGAADRVMAIEFHHANGNNWRIGSDASTDDFQIKDATGSKDVFTVTPGGDATILGDVSGATLTASDGATGTFTTVDGKTVTVINGIITSIV